MACPPSWVLSQTDRENEAAERGTLIHKFLEVLVKHKDVSVAMNWVSENIKDEVLVDFLKSMEVEEYDV